MLEIFKHLLPRAKAWHLTAGKPLTQLFEGWGNAYADARVFFDDVWEDILPSKTRQLDDWESQFALPDTGLTEQERRDRLDAAWKATGGQDPRYLQDTLQAAGFDVYVHEWWVPSVEHPQGGSVDGDVTPAARNPATHLKDTANLPFWICGANHDNAGCGDDLMYCASSTSPPGYVLVNKDDGSYLITGDTSTFPYFLYFGAETFPGLATVPAARKDEFETLCLKICPTEQWLGMLINYS